MRKIREVLRLHFECDCRHRQIAVACSASPATVSDYLDRAEQAGLTWEQAKVLNDAEVEARLFKFIGRREPSPRAAIDFKWVPGATSEPQRRDAQSSWLSGSGSRRALAGERGEARSRTAIGDRQ